MVRDHGGPGQGLYEDDGYDSLAQDCKYMHMLHIDPWKKYPNFAEGTEWTADMIRFCYRRNPNMLYEIGTEQSIRKFDPNEINNLVEGLKRRLATYEYEQIKYCVIQSGTSLKENSNTGLYDKQRLIDMIDVVKSHNLLTKEHNGDYLPASLIKQKMDLGLDSINIAPEFGQIETKTYLEKIKHYDASLIDLLWDICYQSRRWEKWVGDDFAPEEQKEELINICGHYVLSDNRFISGVRPHFPNIDREIKNNIKKKLRELYV